MRRNLRTRLRRGRPGDAWASFDRLPPVLRAWIAGAAIPWCPRSVARLWARVQAEGGDETAWLDRLDRAEARLLARDAPRIWGEGHPCAQAGRRVLRR
ncbi:DUF6525 family protein [Rubellimicrobium sp. CFH 75288]|uniref:DUF6525 family protein n=1 Tax=Rubellimicrobium sp. CFH 75288 TaxID=2697034 RepID=UPI001412D5C6|nr:DUF6525 family protein [Rubellimicrobium sp. CFH 75288]NAZ37531.1 hypothetical protein [Rubellimicrobium sp. CFH 75288]